MIKDLVNAIKSEAEHINGIKTFKYEGQDLINAQNNNYTCQIWVEDDIFVNYLVTKDVVKVTLNIDILDKCYQKDDELDVHDYTYKVAVVLMKLLDSKYKDIISIYDYSIMALSKYSDDNLYGQRLTLDLFMPSPIDECNIDDYLDEENEFMKNEDKEIDVIAPTIDIDDLNITPKKLRRNGE